ncbi:unnamed protein product [Staurois parvus]|uniref:Uncharacterized protein n=1 Tax=Staurois parvus TaxID=386267 RepID=A0ABN9CFV1_9NEOB|nr:unnamed protein product [Staurois parvus]
MTSSQNALSCAPPGNLRNRYVHSLVVTLLGGTGGCIAGHRWVHCWAQVGGTCVWHCWAPIIRALMISDPDDQCRSL